jgi:Asp-tRNA(Asn)/Glu-tRNA(Gln) amidotransferase A subunit family amidase
VRWHRTVFCADLARSYQSYYERDKSKLSDTLRGLIEEGHGILAVDYIRAVEWREVLNRGLDEIFERYDAILTPATKGEAPQDLTVTGDPIFCTLWTFCGNPAVTLPILQGSHGMPMGAQLVGRRGNDARLLRTANWLAKAVQGEDA